MNSSERLKPCSRCNGSGSEPDNCCGHVSVLGEKCPDGCCTEHYDGAVRVLVDPSDPATIERAARALHAKDCGCTDYDHGATVERGDYRDLAAAVLASLTDTGDNKEQTNG